MRDDELTLLRAVAEAAVILVERQRYCLVTECPEDDAFGPGPGNALASAVAALAAHDAQPARVVGETVEVTGAIQFQYVGGNDNEWPVLYALMKDGTLWHKVYRPKIEAVWEIVSLPVPTIRAEVSEP